LDSIATDPALDASSTSGIFMNVDLPQPLAQISLQRFPTPNFTDTLEKKGLGPELHGNTGGDDHGIPKTKKLAAASLGGSNCEDGL